MYCIFTDETFEILSRNDISVIFIDWYVCSGCPYWTVENLAQFFFFVAENLKKLIKGSNDDLGLGAINGIKAISMFFIISGHTLMFMAGGPVLNSNFFAREINLVQNALFINSTLLVDTFLFLSGFLFSRLLLIEIEKRRGQINFLTIYVFRYIRWGFVFVFVLKLM